MITDEGTIKDTITSVLKSYDYPAKARSLRGGYEEYIDDWTYNQIVADITWMLRRDVSTEFDAEDVLLYLKYSRGYFPLSEEPKPEPANDDTEPLVPVVPDATPAPRKTGIPTWILIALAIFGIRA